MAVTGLRVLVTRPAAQSGPIAERLRALGMEPLLLPLFDILPSGNDGDHRARLADARGWDGWIFTSVNAARRVLDLASDLAAWPALYAVGEATAAVLEQAGRGPVRIPEAGSTSEALLASSELASPSRRRWLICTGEGGRDALAPELRRRGAVAERLELYRRVAIEHPAAHVREVAGRCDAVICTSGEGLERLHALLPPELRRRLAGTLLVVPSQRVLELARHLGFAEVRTPLKTSDPALVDCLVQSDRPAVPPDVPARPPPPS